MPLFLVLLQIASPSPASPNGGYWQQYVSYDIQASLDEPSGVLSGTQRVRYHNHSPDTLVTISFHLYLNAFRPGSRWADADSVEHRRRFNDLKDPDFAFNHVSHVRIMGQPAEPVYPFAPDSTVVRFRLPRPLLPGDSLSAEMDWDARPSTLPRRQGRRGRAFDFAQWYPRVVAYDRLGWQEHPLYPAGEFYGDFGDFTVTLDVPADQVVGATGVPACGDPGWEGANRRPGQPVEYQRDWYPAFQASLGPDACAPQGPGRKTIVWRAEDVHHFAISMRPDYSYEGGRFGPVAIHVLYQPGDEGSWGDGTAVTRTAIALEWLDGLFGPFPWPQITNVHRIEGGGTEFPMMIHDGSAGQGLILHELGHNYLMGILASNEWREGYLDEGFTSFQTSWYFEEHGAGEGPYRELERAILDWDLDDLSEPVSLVSEDYRDFVTYNTMISSRGELFYHQLRAIVGDDPMRRILRTYYDRWKLKHVDEAAFRAVAEEASGRDLSTFFAQWLHGTTLYDYGIGRIEASRRGEGWVTRVEVTRQEQGILPIDVLVRAEGDSAAVRTDGRAERAWVTVHTRGKPREVVLDPRGRSHDWDRLDNTRRRGLFGLGWTGPKPDVHVDRVVSTRSHRDREAVGLLPTVWYNDAGGVMPGLRLRSNYLGRFDEVLLELNVATGDCCSGADRLDNWYVRLRNPRFLRGPLTTVTLEGFHVEGRHGAGISWDRRGKGHLTFGATTSVGASLRWLATDDTTYLLPAQYENAGTVEGEVHVRSSEQRGGGAWRVTGAAFVGGGVEYKNRGGGLDTGDRYDTQPYVRLSGEIAARRSLGAGAGLGLRLFGGLISADDDPVRQRWFRVAGADPYERMRNPFIRSRDALLTGDFHFHAPGGGNVRGLDPSLAVTRMLALNVEVDRSVIRRPRSAIAREVRVAAFADGAYTDGFFTRRGQNDFAADAGVGLRVEHRIGETTFVTRFDFPIFALHPDRALGVDDPLGDSRFRFRWTFGVTPAF